MMYRIVFILILCSTTFTASAKYSGGIGEPNDPYQIATPADLILLGETPEDYDKHFILTAEIDLDPNLPGRKMFQRAVIAPDVQYQGLSFSGVFNGNGHSIKNLIITAGNVDYVGLFGKIESEAIIHNVVLEKINIVGYEYVGGLVGNNQGSVQDCSTSGKVNGGHQVGGLIGLNEIHGNISNCYNTGEVYGISLVGGLTGNNRNDGVISCCYNIGNVNAGSRSWAVGGLVGKNQKNGTIISSYSKSNVSGATDTSGGLLGWNEFTGTVSSSYSNGTVKGGYTIGGLAGRNRGNLLDCYTECDVTGYIEVGGFVGTNSSIIINSYSTGSVVGGSTFGGFIGRGFGDEVFNSFWDIETSGRSISDGGTPKTTAEMQTAVTFIDAGWDFLDETKNGFDDIWVIREGLDYPRLWWEKRSNGTRDPNDLYQIATAEYLILMGESP